MRVVLTVLVAIAVFAMAPSAAARAEVPELGSPGSELRVALSRLLAEHVFLTVEAMRAVESESPDETAARDALEDNTVAIEGVIKGSYGDAAGARFATMWRDHIVHLMHYAEASRSGDEAARSAAVHGLDEYRVRLSRFLGDANPNVAPQALAEALHLHTDQLQALLNDDQVAAFAAEREAYGHMFTVGDGLAAALIDQFPRRYGDGGLAFSPSVTLWLTLSRLLGEHLILAAEAMRAGLGGGSVYAGASGAMEANTRDLGAAVESIYGPDAARAFERLWGDHVAAYLAFVDAVRSGDRAAEQARRDDLARYAPTFATFMVKANPFLDPDELQTAIAHHTRALVDQVDAYRSADYPRAYAEVRQAHDHMFDIAKVLAAAFTAQRPQTFPLPATSTDRTDPVGGPTPIPLLIIVGIAAVVVSFMRRQRSRR